MIAFVFAAALVFEPAPKLKVADQSLRPASEQARVEAAKPMLESVSVTLECTARANGNVDNCSVLGETHPGLGFGEAALALMRDAEVQPGPRDIQFARTILFMP